MFLIFSVLSRRAFQMNEELEAKGFLTIAGRVSRKYYEEKFYGITKAD